MVPPMGVPSPSAIVVGCDLGGRAHPLRHGDAGAGNALRWEQGFIRAKKGELRDLLFRRERYRLRFWGNGSARWAPGRLVFEKCPMGIPDSFVGGKKPGGTDAVQI